MVRRALAGLGAAEVISTLGTEMTAVALPWFVLVSTGSPARMGAVLAAEFAGMALLGLWGGRLVDGLGPRRLMLVADLTRAALIAAIPMLYEVSTLPFTAILGIGVLVGACFPAYTSAQRLVLAGIVGDNEVRLTRAGGLLGALNEFGSFGGPALGGLLIVAFGPVNVLLLDATTYLAAFALVALLVPARLTPPTEEPGGIVAGLRYLVRHRALRRQVAGVGLVEVGFTAMVATLPLLALHHGGPSVAGWLLASFGAGSVVGGLLSTRARAPAADDPDDQADGAPTGAASATGLSGGGVAKGAPGGEPGAALVAGGEPGAALVAGGEPGAALVAGLPGGGLVSEAAPEPGAASGDAGSGVGGRTAGLAIAGIAASAWLLLAVAVLVPAPPLLLAGPVALDGICCGLFFPRFFSALTARTPTALRATVMTSTTIAISVPGPLGFLGAGLLAQHTGATTASLVLVALSATAGAALVGLRRGKPVGVRAGRSNRPERESGGSSPGR